MARLDGNPTLLNALNNNTPFIYAHLVKFERPSNKHLPASANSFSRESAQDFAYFSDAAFDVVFDDSSKDILGNSNGAQNYIANKLISVGNLSDSSEVKITSTNLVLDATPIDTSFTDSISVATHAEGFLITATNTNFADAGFRVGDTITFNTGLNAKNEFQINRILNNAVICTIASSIVASTRAKRGTASNMITLDQPTAAYGIQSGDLVTGPGIPDNVVVSSTSGTNSFIVTGNLPDLSTTAFVNVVFSNRGRTHSAFTLTVSLASSEITGLLHSSGLDKVNFVNRRVTIYKAFFYADNPHTFIGDPIEVFRGVITNSSFEEDPMKGARVTWNLSNFLGDFRRVRGRTTSHEAHQGITEEGGVSTRNALRPAYALDRGFEHSETSINLLARYGDFEKEVKYKKKRILFGLLGSYKEPNGYKLIPVTREVDLRFDLEAKYLPVVYGVQRVKGIPIFADVAKDLTPSRESAVYTANAICEGPIQSVMNIYIDDKPLSCMNLSDTRSRNPNASGSTDAQIAAANNEDVVCVGQADQGIVLQGDFPGTTFSAAAVSDFYNGSYIPQAEIQVQGAQQTAIQDIDSVRIFDIAPLGHNSGPAGVTHEKAIRFSSPMETSIEIHAGLRDQRASSILATQAKTGNGFTIQAEKGLTSTPEKYWGSSHKVLDTAYSVNKFTLGTEETTIPSIDYVVNGKMLDCYNYDGTYLHPDLPIYSSENHTNFKEGDTVAYHTVYAFTSTKTKLNSSGELVLIGDGVGSGETAVAYVSGAAMFSTTLLEKFYYYDFNQAANYRFRSDLDIAKRELLKEARYFYLQKGSDQWHMQTFDAPVLDTASVTTGSSTQVVPDPISVTEVYTADITQTSSGNSSFTGTTSNETAATADYTDPSNAASVVMYEVVPEDVAIDILAEAGVYDVRTDELLSAGARDVFPTTRTTVLPATVTQITGGTQIAVANTDSQETLPTTTKVTIVNKVRLGGGASTVNDLYNGRKIVFTRSTGDAGVLSIERTIIDYDGSSKMATLDNDITQGLIQVGDSVSIAGESAERVEIIPGTTISAGVGIGDLRPSTNFALIALDYIKSERYGLNIALRELNLNSFLLAAEECDTQSDVTIAFNPVVSLTAGDTYEYVVNGHLKWRGTVKESVTSSATAQFTNVVGKLTNKFNTYASREVGDLVYSSALYKVSSAGVQAAVSSNASLASNITLTKVGTSSTITINTSLINPVTEYSFYDSDDLSYWKYLGWPEQKQRYVTRHQGNLVVDTAAPVLDNLKGILQHFNAMLYTVGGKINLKVKAARNTSASGPENDTNFTDSSNDVDVRVRYITDEDVIGKISLKDEGLNKSHNTVGASIADPALDFNDRSITFLDSVAKLEDRGVTKSANFALPGITNYYNARMAATQALRASRVSRTISFVMRPAGIAILPGELIRVNYPRFGWSAGSEVLFRVTSVSIAKDCLVSITAEEHDDNLYLISKNIKSPFFIDEIVGPEARTPGIPGNVDVDTLSDASHNRVTWTAALGISATRGYYEIWRAETASGNANTPVTTHATFLGLVPSDQLYYPDYDAKSSTAQNFIYWIRALNLSNPQTSSGVKKESRRYYGSFNTDSDLGGVGAAYAAQAKLKALQESIIVDLSSDSVALPASSSGVVSDFSNASGTISVFIGTTALSQGTGFTIGTPTVSSGAGTTVTVTGANYSLSGALNTESATVTFPITVLANSTTGLAGAVTRSAIMNLAKTRVGATGAAGSEGRTVELDPSSNVINYNTAGAETDTITFTATARHFSGTPYYQFFVGPVGGSLSVKQSFSTTNTFSLADSDEPAIGAAVKVLVQTKDGGSGGAIVAQDSVTIFGVQDGSDAVTGFLTNESHAVNANFLGGGIPSFSSAGGTFKIFVGSTDVTTSCTFSVVSESGVDVSIGSSNGIYTVNSMSLDSGVASLKAVVPAATAGAASNVEITKVYTISKAKNAAPNIVGDLSNSSAAVAANSAGVVTTSSLNTVGGTFEVRKDGALINSDSAVTFAIQGSVSPSSGFNVAINANTGVYSISGFTVNQGQVTFRATIQTSISGLSSTTTIDKTYTLTRAKEGTEAITIDVSNPVINLPTTTAGVVTYTNSGTDISVKEGSTSLNYGTSGVGTFSIAASGTNITVGSASTVSSTIRRFAAASNITADEAFIAFTITIRRTTGAAAETRVVTQRLVKAKQGATGADGDDAHGVEYIFAVTANESTAPSSTNNSWGFDQPVSPWFDAAPSVTSTNKALWRAQRDILGSPSAGDSVSASWTTPVVVGKFGDTGPQGESVVEVQAFRSGSNSGLSGGSYNFNTSTLTPPSGWSVNPISLTSNNQVVYVGKGTSVGASTDTAASITWGSTAIYAQRTDGSTGATGPRTATGYIYYQQASSSNPGAPSESGVSYNFSTSLLSGGVIGTGSTNWNQIQPPYTGNNSNKYWYAYFSVTEASFNGTQTIDFSIAYEGQNFTGLVTFTGTGKQISDGSNNLTAIEASDLGSTGSTTIDGARITTGSIKSANISGTQDGSAFTSAGSLFNLTNGVIASKNFRIDSSGNAAFSGTLIVGGSTVRNDTASNFRSDIGAGTSSFDGDYGSLANSPTNLSDFTNDSGFVVPSGVATAINNNTTTIDGAKITTGTIDANRIATNSILSNVVYVGNDLIINSSGAIYTSGKSSWSDTSAGFFLGYENSFGTAAYKLKIGNSTNFISWNGSDLTVSGNITVKNASTVRTALNVEDGATANPNAVDPADVASHLGGANTTTISGGIINTGTINASSIKIDNITLDTDGNNLIIKNSGVNINQLASSSLGTARGVSDGDVAATQQTYSFSLFSINTPAHMIGAWGSSTTLILDEVATFDFTTAAHSGNLRYEVSFEFAPSGTFSSSTTVALVYHIQQTINGQSYLYNQDNSHANVVTTYSGYSFGTGSAANRLRRIARFLDLTGNRQTYIRLYGYQQGVTGNQEYDGVHLSVTALTKGTT